MTSRQESVAQALEVSPLLQGKVIFSTDGLRATVGGWFGNISPLRLEEYMRVQREPGIPTIDFLSFGHLRRVQRVPGA
ncbi:MAG: hypothetical protein M3R67_01685 [Acidobacteriota bacterium]|nr:hypothetical protein [Acidobacteriota bacterium]